MNRFAKFEENDDGTTSFTGKFEADGELVLMLLPFPFESFIQGLIEHDEIVKETIVIPNEV